MTMTAICQPRAAATVSCGKPWIWPVGPATRQDAWLSNPRQSSAPQPCKTGQKDDRKEGGAHQPYFDLFWFKYKQNNVKQSNHFLLCQSK